MARLEAFVYVWKNLQTGVRYIGCHKGTPDDGYDFSSNYLREDYEKNPEMFSRQIFAYGKTKEMFEWESALQKKVDAKKSSKFYNKHNGDGKFLPLEKQTAEHIRKRTQKRIGTKLPDTHPFKTKKFTPPWKGGTRPEHSRLMKAKVASGELKMPRNTPTQKVLYNGILYNSVKKAMETTGVSYYLIRKTGKYI